MLHAGLLLSLALASSPAARERTWADPVADVVHRNCSECHRPGEAAPFPLIEYSEVRKRARTIQAVVEDGYMPPWHPVEGHGEFKDERRLSARDRATLLAWIEAGCPEGDPAAAPPAPEFTDGWRLGEPDLVLEMAEGYAVPASGPDIYRNFCLPLALEQERWVTAIEVRPSARTVVHHVLFFWDDADAARAKDALDDGPGYSGMAAVLGGGGLGGWAVGGGPFSLAKGLALRLPAGSDLVLQTHFHPSGKPEEERTRIGLYFADAAPTRPIVGIALPPMYAVFDGLEIPAGEPRHVLTDSVVLPVETELMSVGAHAHYLATEIRAWAELPDGGEVPLLFIDDWDFNWQGSYVYREPVTVPAGSVLRVELIYDNSAGNPRNPSSPPIPITWGLETLEEMGQVGWTASARDPADHQRLARALGRKFGRAWRDRTPSIDWFALIMRVCDANEDGILQELEIPGALSYLLEMADLNDDGALGAMELELVEAFLKRDLKSKDD